MCFVFESDQRQVEYWLKPFTARAMFPGYRHRLFENTRSFWSIYWQLLLRGYTEPQLADYALGWQVYHRQPTELAVTLSVLHLGRIRDLRLPESFVPPTSTHHPRGYAAACLD